MSEATITLILSDLHVGGGPADPGDDHVYAGNQLVTYIDGLAAGADGQAGRIELFFNGDFLEFAQTATSAFAHDSDKAWCSEAESLQKLEAIIAGHGDIFEALARLQSTGNLVTIAAGNHDVDLYWPAVQARLREVAGPGLRFEIGKEWVERYGGMLQIGHGHMSDPANRFQNWSSPLALGASGEPRLEMCPGTLFMVKFVNRIEQRYPFADNLVPVTRLASVLWQDDRSGFCAVAWAFGKFLATSSTRVLGSGAQDDYGARLVKRFRLGSERRQALNAALAEHECAAHGFPDAASVTEERLADAMFALLGRLGEERWRALFELGPSPTLARAGGATLSAIDQSNKLVGREQLRAVAKARAAQCGASVVVMGHTHLADVQEWDGVRYYNPGSWTRFLEVDGRAALTLEQLKDESLYPYALHAVRVAREGEALVSAMECIERYPA